MAERVSGVAERSALGLGPLWPLPVNSPAGLAFVLEPRRSGVLLRLPFDPISQEICVIRIEHVGLISILEILFREFYQTINIRLHQVDSTVLPRAGQ